MKENVMKKESIARGFMIASIVGTFTLGYVCGSLNQRYAAAQVPGLGDALQRAGQSGGTLGNVSQLGSSIVEMQEHVNGLQKNIDTLKKFQASLTGK
jgi:hypothetical protein